MILNTAPQNEAILSNVGEIGEFRIRNSAKAFNILSSGLYANKIRAIVRELSCNAVDSHVAAGKQDTPFDVHMPNQLEPWFAIRDYGTGLSHEQVTNIYTTYFESTKTASNEFIGALGLGSKSPFSYTDNFTVTAVQNGRRGIYSAFINAEGVPSIAMMGEEDTDEPNGVEVKFAVNDRWDFDKFRQEARHVYRYFSLKPVVSGSAEFTFDLIDYTSRDIIPGVHQIRDSNRCIAVMGNIAYPVDIPNAEVALGDLRGLLTCGLEMHFAIGELDFQASREGLSYIPQTIEAIKRKFEAVNAVLADRLAEEANAVENLWDRALFLITRKDNRLWTAAVVKYATDTQLPTYDVKAYGGYMTWNLRVDELAKQFNIQLRGFQRSRGSKTCSNLKADTEWGNVGANGHRDTWTSWRLRVEAESHFVINDTKIGATERAKYHYKNTTANVHSRNVYVLEPVDRTKGMLTDAFFAAIHNPPKDRIFNASALDAKPRASGITRNVTILKLERRNSGGYYREREMVWREGGKVDSFDASTTFYYVPLSGFTMQSAKGYTSGKELYEDVNSMPGLFGGDIYGVRKGDIEEIKKRKNWVNLEEHIATTLNGKDHTKILLSLVKSMLDDDDILQYNNISVLKEIDDNSPYAKLVKDFINVGKFEGNKHNMDRLFRKFAPTATLSPDALVAKYQKEVNEIKRRYPLLVSCSYRTEASYVAEYINLIDAKKGI
jgi:hypothetical protein